MSTPKIRIRKSENSFQLFLQTEKVSKKNKARNIELTAFFYPLDKHTHSDDFHFWPYEEYVDDLLEGKQTTFVKSVNTADKLFGALLALIIAGIFAYIDIGLLISVEAVISLFAGYTFGKEVWNELEEVLIRFTQKFPISFHPPRYAYEKQYYGSIERYLDYAREARYKSPSLIASRFDFAKQSNSKFMRLLFSAKELAEDGESPIRIGEIEDETGATHGLLKNENYMLGFKIVKVRNFLFVEVLSEFYQAECKGKVGYLNRKDEFIEGQFWEKRSLQIGRVKVFLWARSVVGKVIRFE